MDSRGGCRDGARAAEGDGRERRGVPKHGELAGANSSELTLL